MSFIEKLSEELKTRFDLRSRVSEDKKTLMSIFSFEKFSITMIIQENGENSPLSMIFMLSSPLFSKDKLVTASDKLLALLIENSKLPFNYKWALSYDENSDKYILALGVVSPRDIREALSNIGYALNYFYSKVGEFLKASVKNK